jgi:hypothetical protein
MGEQRAHCPCPQASTQGLPRTSPVVTQGGPWELLAGAHRDRRGNISAWQHRREASETGSCSLGRNIRRVASETLDVKARVRSGCPFWDLAPCKGGRCRGMVAAGAADGPPPLLTHKDITHHRYECPDTTDDAATALALWVYPNPNPNPNPCPTWKTGPDGAGTSGGLAKATNPGLALTITPILIYIYTAVNPNPNPNPNLHRKAQQHKGPACH